jgi:uncharacterized membrane protein HdeD (DUF308 family)
MNSILKSVVLLGIIAGIVYLASNDLPGWGWLVFLFVLTLVTNEDSNQNKNESEIN